MSPGSINLKSESRQVCLIPKLMLFITGYSLLHLPNRFRKYRYKSSIRDLKELPAAILSKPLLRVCQQNLWEKSQWITSSLSLHLLSLSLGKIWSKVFLLLLCVFSSRDLIRVRGPGRTVEKGLLRTRLCVRF